MKTANLFRQHSDAAKLAGMFASYWSVQSCGLGNDRTPEITQGSCEGSGYA
jgi:hypothetical protein